MAKWRKDNKERWDEINARSREKNKERTKAKQRERYHATKHLLPPLTEEQKARRSVLNRAHRLKANYGLTVEDYETMWNAQDGVCAICRKPDPTHPNLAVDHCHTTGKVRGLLCRVCNPAIGALGDTPETLDRAVSYLRGELGW